MTSIILDNNVCSNNALLHNDQYYIYTYIHAYIYSLIFINNNNILRRNKRKPRPICNLIILEKEPNNGIKEIKMGHPNYKWLSNELHCVTKNYISSNKNEVPTIEGI